MATNAQKSTTGNPVKNAPTSPTAANPEPRPSDKRAEPRAKTDQAQRTKPPAQPSRKAAQKPKHRPYHAEIVALADTTAGLPPPWRKQAIHIVYAIMNLFKRAWRELRRRLPPVADDAEAPSPAAAGDPTIQS